MHTATYMRLGFDSALMGSINALPNYTSYFGLPETGNASTGLVFSIFQVCFANSSALRGLSYGASG